MPKTDGQQRRFPLRWRLAGANAALTCAVLIVFAGAVGSFLSDSTRTDFEDSTVDAANTLAQSTSIGVGPNGFVVRGTDVNDYAGSQHARIRLVDLSGNVIAQSVGAPDFGIRPIGTTELSDYLVITRPISVGPLGRVLVQYARPTQPVERTINAIWLALAVGVGFGSLLALIAGLSISKRTLLPLARLTDAAGEISRTADPRVGVPIPDNNDEVQDLAVTLNGAFAELERARAETEAALERQREFVADASHELRTPLTALLANLEMLATDAKGDARDDAEAALRSARRMRTLVADLLLLARADSKESLFARVDLARVVETAVEEISPLLGGRTLKIQTEPILLMADEGAVQRALSNLLANAVIHTPDETAIHLELFKQGATAVLRVEDSGDGIAATQQGSIFERFKSGAGDSGKGTGLGLAIVKAVASTHGGSVSVGVSDQLGGASFVLKLPLVQASTTTGTTIGRRFS